MEGKHMSFIDNIIAFLQNGGSFIYPIALVLVVGLAITIERWLYLSSALSTNQKALVSLQSALKNGDIDVISDGKDIVIGGIMEHIEQAGIHSGDSACVLPAYELSSKARKTIEKYTQQLQVLNKELKLKRLRNATLTAEVMDLRKGQEAIEEIARYNLGLIKDGESFYQVIE